MIPRATLLFLTAVLLLACQSPSQGQTTPSPEQTQPSAGTVDPAQPTNAQPTSPAAAEPARPNFVAWRDAFKTEALAAGGQRQLEVLPPVGDRAGLNHLAGEAHYEAAGRPGRLDHGLDDHA